ncbi:MAG: hypothetical protein LBS40_02960, partial [Burkholderiales bacterium]|nr:hypothetical protein [Burkholderiales bacterium]
LEWVDWFNHRGILQPIGNIPPTEAEQRYDQQQAEIMRYAVTHGLAERNPVADIKSRMRWCRGKAVISPALTQKKCRNCCVKSKNTMALLSRGRRCVSCHNEQNK